jgi:hypothetical protein
MTTKEFVVVLRSTVSRERMEELRASERRAGRDAAAAVTAAARRWAVFLPGARPPRDSTTTGN